MPQHDLALGERETVLGQSAVPVLAHVIHESHLMLGCGTQPPGHHELRTQSSVGSHSDLAKSDARQRIRSRHDCREVVIVVLSQQNHCVPVHQQSFEEFTARVNIREVHATYTASTSRIVGTGARDGARSAQR